MPTFTQTINLTPYWAVNQPRIVLVAQYFTTAAYAYSATITGPGLPNGINFPDNNAGCSMIDISSVYVANQNLPYLLTINTNSPTLNMQVQNSTEIGTKPNGDAISYQGYFFSNDAGSDTDWNDCVITLALYNHSTD